MVGQAEASHGLWKQTLQENGVNCTRKRVHTEMEPWMSPPRSQYIAEPTKNFYAKGSNADLTVLEMITSEEEVILKAA